MMDLSDDAVSWQRVREYARKISPYSNSKWHTWPGASQALSLLEAKCGVSIDEGILIYETSDPRYTQQAKVLYFFSNSDYYLAVWKLNLETPPTITQVPSQILPQLSVGTDWVYHALEFEMKMKQIPTG